MKKELSIVRNPRCIDVLAMLLLMAVAVAVQASAGPGTVINFSSHGMECGCR